MSLISNLLDKFGISASLAQADDFEKWLVNTTWSKYNEDKMNTKIVIENKVKALLGLRFNNGTVRKEYMAQIELPSELVEDAWLEGLPEGLKCDVEECPELTVNNDETSNFQDDTSLDVNESADINTLKNDKIQKLILKVYGKPIEAGDFTLKLVYKPKGWLTGEDFSSVNLPIAFNPDPRSLWKNIPTPETVAFYKPDYEAEYVKVEETEESGPRKDIVAASQRGRSHAQEGKPRDDHFKLYHSDDSDWYIIAVADGAGSARYSRKGSQIACDTVVNYCKEQLINSDDFEDKIRAYKAADDDENARKQMANIIYNIIGNAALKAHKAIKEAADANEALSINTKDMATTLMFAICKKFDFGWFVASYWVGDGAMCIFNENKKTFKLLGIPDEGEFSGQTRFLTMPEIFKDAKAVMDRLRFSIEEDFTALMLMTDGISDPMFETENNLNSYDKWAELWNRLKTGFPEDEIPGVELSDDNDESKYQLLRWLDFWSAGNHDDRTIAILY